MGATPLSVLLFLPVRVDRKKWEKNAKITNKQA